MPSQEDVDNQRDQLLVHRRYVNSLLKQQGQLGAFAPPYVQPEIQDRRAAIQQIKMTLRGWGQSVEDLPDDGAVSSVGQLSNALLNMADRMQVPAVRDRLDQFHSSLTLLNQQLQILQTYKDLHDQLHQLQFGCYRPIMVGARKFPRNQTFITSLGLYTVELKLLIASLLNIVARPNFPAQERAWIHQLISAYEQLDLAFSTLKREPFELARDLIERVLNLQPTRINERLKSIARGLPFDALVQVLVLTKSPITVEASDNNRTVAMDQGIAAVEQVRARLAQLIDEHDIWQRFDLDLRQYENDPSRYVQIFTFLWQTELKPSLLKIYQQRSDPWTLELKRSGELLEQTFTASTVTQSEAGRAFYSCFGKCFFQADKELKEQCEQLRLIDGPLKSVIGMYI